TPPLHVQDQVLPAPSPLPTQLQGHRCQLGVPHAALTPRAQRYTQQLGRLCVRQHAAVLELLKELAHTGQQPGLERFQAKLRRQIVRAHAAGSKIWPSSHSSTLAMRTATFLVSRSWPRTARDNAASGYVAFRATARWVRLRRKSCARNSGPRTLTRSIGRFPFFVSGPPVRVPENKSYL